MYKICDFIKSTGSQYIDTGFVPNNNTSIEMQIDFTDISANGAFFCARGKSTDENTYSCFFISGSGIRFDYYNYDYSSSYGSTSYIPSVADVFIVKTEKNKIYINGVLKYTYSETSFEAGGTMWLLASYIRSGTGYGSLANYSKARVYYCKIYDGDTLVRDFVPVLDTDSGKAGLYDNVNGVFYASKGNNFEYKLQYNSIEDIVSGAGNMDFLVNGTKYDDNSYSISGVPDFVKYKRNVVSSIYANGNSWIGFGQTTEHFKFNRRDAAMYYLFKEEGTFQNHSFFRIRWSGMANYNSYGDPYKQGFDLLIFDTGDVMLYAVDIPTSYYDGTFYFADVSYTAPTTDSRYVTFYANEDGTYNTVYAPIEFSPAYVTKYLVRDGSTIYTVTDGALVELSGNVGAELFHTKGAEEIPDGALLMTLSTPEVLCWTDADEAPKLTATVQGNPIGSHEIVSDNIPIGHSSIYGITSVEATASEGARFLLSFDGGLWMVYDTSSNAFVASDTGMTAAELVAIPTDAWTSVVNSAENMRLKSVIEGVENVTKVKFNFNNASPI